MIIEMNKDIDKYQESVALGLTAKQLIFSITAVVCGGGIVLLLYKHVGLTVSAYIAIPVVAPIALGGFYSFHGMSFYEMVRRKWYFMFENHALLYQSTECEEEINQFKIEEQKQQASGMKSGNKEADFQKSKKMMLMVLLALAVLIAGGIAVAIWYQCKCNY